MTATPPPALPEAEGFDFDAMSGRDKYKLMIGAIVPRPIAWVTTVDAEGRANAAPFSFFSCLSADPAILAIGVEYRPDGRSKDTGGNIRQTGAFTVNIVPARLMDAMNVTAVPFPPGIDELAHAGLTQRPGLRVPCPAIAEAPAAFECRHHTTLTLSPTREIVLGQVVYAHLHSDVVNERHHVDPVGLDAVGRMGGHGYATTRDYFDLPTMTLDEWTSRNED